MTELRLAARAPFSLAAVVGSHGWVQLAPFSRGARDSRLNYIRRLESGHVVELLIAEATDGVSVTVDGSLSGAEEEQVAHDVGWMLDLGRDYAAFYALAKPEPKLAQVEERAQGRILRSPTLFEDVVKTILTTNTAWGGTIRMAGALVSEFGDPLPADTSRQAFPTPERLADAGEKALRSAAGLGYRAPYVLELARNVASGALDLEAIKSTSLPTSILRGQLLAIKGVGDYAAANLLMILGRYDFVPVDSWARKVVSHEWYGGEPVGRAEVEAAFDRWGAWRGLAYWFWNWSLLGEN